jgi:uncharacterized protein (TIGR02246 family)
MRALPSSLLLLALLLSTPAVHAAEPAAATPPDGTVESLLAHQSAAWSRGDIEAFCSVYADDALFLSPTGLTRGRQAVIDRYKKRYPGAAAMGTLTLEVLEVRPDAAKDPAMASVAARWKIAYPGKAALEGVTLIVFRKIDGAWKIVQDASM